MTGYLDIKGIMPGLNDYSGAERTHRQAAAQMKRTETERVAWAAKAQLPIFKKQIRLHIVYREKNRKRDKDNIAFAKKFILDGLKDAGRIPNDGWAWIDGWSEGFIVDANDPGITVIINEVEKQS